MARAFSWFLAYRYFVSRWVNVLGMGGVAVAVWALIVVVSVMSGFIQSTRDHIRSATPELLTAGLPPDASYEEFAAKIGEVRGVAATAPRLSHYGLYYLLHKFTERVKELNAAPTPQTALGFEFVELIGIDPELEHETTPLADWLDDARWPVERPREPFVLSPERLATALDRPDHEIPLRSPPGLLLSDRRLSTSRGGVGSEISLVSVREPDSADDPLRKLRRVFCASGTFRTGSRVFDATKALVHIDDMREFLGYGPFDPDVVNAIAIRPKPGHDLDELAAAIDAHLGDPAIRTLTWRAQNAMFLNVVGQERGMLKLILSAISLVSAFLIYATMNMMVTQKTKDVGILSAIGATRRSIRTMFLICGSTIGILGALLGAVSGWATAFYINEIEQHFIGGVVTDTANFVGGLFGAAPIPPLKLFPIELYALDEIPVVIDPAWITQVVVGALLMTLLAAWLPARRAARLEPVKALGYE